MFDGRNRWLIMDALLLGVVGAFSAQLFMFLLHWAGHLFLQWFAGYQAPSLPGEGGSPQQIIGGHGLWLIPIATTLGGLISGLLVYSMAPEAEGHGTDTAVKAFHRSAGFIRARVAPLKVIASAITIGSGGAAGREGPTALIAAGIGSIYGTLLKRSERERRLLVLIGMAAGLSAIFRSPIGTAIFAIEVLYSDMEFEAPALLYTMLSSLVAYVINGLFVGWEPLFRVPADIGSPGFMDYGWYVMLGVGAGAVAALLPVVFYGLRDLFRLIPIPNHVKPAIGGLGVGLLALALPQVLGGGYGWIQNAIDGHLAVKVLLVLVFAKMLAFALTVSSGGSGGVFAPSLFVGAMFGGLLGKLFDQPSAAFAVVGMAAVFGGAARIPIATLLMVTEMTGGYQLLVPAALAVMLSYLVQSTLTRRIPYRSLYEAQVSRRADSPAHQAEHLRIAMDLLASRQVVAPDVIGHLDLIALMESGVAIDLTDDKRLTIGVLRADSSWVGKTPQDPVFRDAGRDMELVAVLRQGDMLLPNPGLHLQAGDRLLLIAAWRLEEQIARQVEPLPAR